jgi:hypothetical protein
MEYDGKDMKDENREEMEKFEKMSPYDRLHHLRKMALFCKDLGEENSMIAEVLIITKGY